MIENMRPCPTCNATERGILFAQRFEALTNISLMRGYDVVVCHGCGLVFADHIPPDEAFSSYYAEASKYEYGHRNGELCASERQRLSRLARRIAAVAPVSARLLDVGSSTGGLLAELQEQGFSSLTGLDPSEACVRYARATHGFEMIHQTLGARPAATSPFDVIVLSAVLEHVPNLHTFLDFVDEWLVPKGLVIVEVPDAEYFAAGFNAPYQEFSVEHINFFSLPALDNLLGAHGYSRIAKYHDLCGAGGNLTASVVTAMYRGGSDRVGPVRELASESGVRSYLTRCVATTEAERNVIAKLVESQAPVLIWGVGTLCQRLLASTELKDANIVAFVDSNPHYQGSSLIGRPVLAPSELRARSEPILVLSWGFFDEIRTQIRKELGLKNEIMLIDGI